MMYDFSKNSLNSILILINLNEEFTFQRIKVFFLLIFYHIFQNLILNKNIK